MTSPARIARLHRWVWVFDSTDMQMKHVLDSRVRSADPLRGPPCNA